MTERPQSNFRGSFHGCSLVDALGRECMSMSDFGRRSFMGALIDAHRRASSTFIKRVHERRSTVDFVEEVLEGRLLVDALGRE